MRARDGGVLVRTGHTEGSVDLMTLAGLQPSAGGDGAWPAIAGADEVHFITDGTVPHSPSDGTRVHSVFEPAPNVAVTAFEVLPAADDPDRAEVFLAITNHAEKRQAVQVNVTRASTVVMSRSIELAAGAVHREMLTVSRAGDARFRVHLGARGVQLIVELTEGLLEFRVVGGVGHAVIVGRW